MKSNPIPTVSDLNPSWGPSDASGPEAARLAMMWGFPLWVRGRHEGEGDQKKWVPADLLAEQQAELFKSKPEAAPASVYVKGFEYRGHVVFRGDDKTPGRIIEQEEGNEIATLAEDESARVAACWLDAYLLSQEDAFARGERRGRDRAESDVQRVASLLFGGVLKDALAPAVEALGELQHAFQNRRS